MKTLSSIVKIVHKNICASPEVYKAFQLRVSEGAPTREQNPMSHFSVYFLPYNPYNKKVFITHHKKSGLWLSPGGHVDEGETLWQTVNREIKEELGVADFFKLEPKPFLLTITPVANAAHACKTHYDVWYLVITDGHDFSIDPREFHATQWMAIDDAKKIVTDPPNLLALDRVARLAK
ncbi:MAG: NUDIX domain-containing protein [Candidatus Falkowbacteria bacterium]